jgi:hypothetical protein
MAFFSEGLKDYENNYSYVEKQVIAVVRSLKKFRHLLSQSRIQLLVPNSSVKDFLLSRDINEKRAGWITKVMEYDVDIKITKLVRGKGLCEQLLSPPNTVEETALVIENEQPIEGEMCNN